MYVGSCEYTRKQWVDISRILLFVYSCVSAVQKNKICLLVRFSHMPDREYTVYGLRYTRLPDGMAGWTCADFLSVWEFT
jgi:hypothetical protein